MSMLKYFFSYGCDTKLFDGLAVAEEKELCETYMGKFPVISVTLKDVESEDFAGAMANLCRVIGREALRFRFLLESTALESIFTGLNNFTFKHLPVEMPSPL